ncbi:MAG TPA: FAD-dependent oxidoreductase, partial [Steroidobacteraceae bacterium]|nr:FAD-dependent oxidoreductase [Steroidobacteraceae bacterium]
MLRNVTRLGTTTYDLVVVGGGIYGACAAWEGALRGLRVALIEAGDFGCATSSNSLRTLHGGLRHLQRLDFRRMRESIRERREWLRLAPHLARPLRFVLPTRGQGLRGPLVMRTALWLNDLISADRNSGVREDRRLPRGAVLSAAAARA